MSPVLRQALLSIAVPGALAGVVLLVAHFLSGFARGARAHGGAASPAQAVAGAIAAAIAYVAGHFLLVGRPPFPPIDATHWPFYFAVGFVTLVALEPLISPAGSRWAVLGVASAGAVYLLLRPLLGNTPTVAMGVAAALFFLLWSCLVVVAHVLPPAQGLFGAAVLAGAASVVLGLSGFASLAQMGGALATGLGVAFLVSLVRPSRGAAVGAASVGGGLVASLTVCGSFYADVPRSSALLLVAGPLAAAAIAVVGAERSALARAAALLAIAGAGGAAVALAFAASEPPSGY